MAKGTPAVLALGNAGVEFVVHEFAHEPSSRNYGV